MKHLSFFGSLARDCRAVLSFAVIIFFSIRGLGQGPEQGPGPAGLGSAGLGAAGMSAVDKGGPGADAGTWKLEKMPADLETDFALSALPPHVRNGATVYLLDPGKGFYVARQGTNGFICFVLRTDWKSGEFRQDYAAAISYDAEGATAIFPVYEDVEAMRASGKFTAAQIKDTIAARYASVFYKAPAKAGLSYMLAPVMRVFVGQEGNQHVKTFSMPHYMFYAPYLKAADIGGDSPSGDGPIFLGDGTDPQHNYIIVPAGEMEKAHMNADNAALLKRLVTYKPYFDPGAEAMHH
jgi:hypothetical protein